MPILQSVGRKTPFENLERSSAIAEVYALSRKYGGAFCFITIAPDDVGYPVTTRHISGNTYTERTLLLRARDGGHQLERLLPDGLLFTSFSRIDQQHREPQLHRIDQQDPAFWELFVPGLKSNLTNTIDSQLDIGLVNASPVELHSIYYEDEEYRDENIRRENVFESSPAAFGSIEECIRGPLHLHMLGCGGLIADATISSDGDESDQHEQGHSLKTDKAPPPASTAALQEAHRKMYQVVI